jgi:hypothetical protein
VLVVAIAMDAANILKFNLARGSEPLVQQPWTNIKIFFEKTKHLKKTFQKNYNRRLIPKVPFHFTWYQG